MARNQPTIGLRLGSVSHFTDGEIKEHLDVVIPRWRTLPIGAHVDMDGWLSALILRIRVSSAFEQAIGQVVQATFVSRELKEALHLSLLRKSQEFKIKMNVLILR